MRMPIYEIEVNRFTKEGTFAALEAHLPEIQKLGVGIIWLMPIFRRGGNPPGKPRSDSPYCVRDYFDVDPRFGTKSDLARLVKKAHSLGLRVILDWVPNHTSWGNPLVTEHPEFYKKDAQGRIAQAGPWADVAQLDYSNREVWEYMLRARLHWIRECDVDGFREDVAGMVPLDHWTWLVPKLRETKPVFMLAEADEPALHQAFDATYDWTLQPYMYMIARGSWPASSVDKLLEWERKTYPAGALRMRHLTNHDMQGTTSAWPNRKYLPASEHKFLDTVPIQEKYGELYRAFAVLCATLPNSVPMLWNGQEIGYIGKTPWPIPWGESPDRDFYSKLLRTYRDSEALREGEFKRLSTGADERVYAFVRTKGQSRAVVVLNLSKEPATARLDSREVAGSYTDCFTGSKTRLGGKDEIALGPCEYRLLLAGTR